MDSLEPGTLLARRYRMLDRIGVGGMSVIWRAHDEMLERSVAVKVLATDLAADSRCRDLVRTEARAAAVLVHPHVTATYDYGETVNPDGEVTAYVVMELLEGEPLSSRLTEGPLPWPEALRVCAEVAEALAAAHRHGIVHRDVTADNVMLTSDGAKVLDFGIATTIGAPDEDAEGLTFGTPAYVAPERLDGRRARPANDTYALGVLLFEALTGNPPYPAETWEELAATRHDDPPRPQVAGLPEPVAKLCQQCLALDPQQRPTAHQVAWTLRRHLPGAGRRVIRRVGLRRALSAVGAAAALAIGVLIGSTLLGGPGVIPEAGTDAGPARAPEPTGDPVEPDPPAGGPGGGVPEPGGDVLPPGAGGDDPPGPAVVPDYGGAGSGTDSGTEDGGTEDGGTDSDGQLTGSPPTEVTLDTIDELVTDGEASGDIRDDVAQDLRNMVDNLQRDLDTGSMDMTTGVAQLRDKVQAREHEGTLGADSAAALYAALDQLGSQT